MGDELGQLESNLQATLGDAKRTLQHRIDELTGANLQKFTLQRVESRGEFYILTSDGHKLEGQNAAQVPINNGAQIFTGRDGYAKLTLPDDTQMTFGPNSQDVLDEFFYDTSPNTPRKMLVTVTKGVFRLVTGAIARDKPENVKVKLAAGDLGFRGTDAEVSVAPDGSGYVALFFGQLEITEKKSGFVFVLNAGQKVKFAADGTFSRPERLEPR